MAPPPQERRTDLDWVRVGAFAILIFFHVAMYYAPPDWEIKSPHILKWLEFPLDWSSPWRLLTLFVVSGAATRFMARKLSLRELLGARSYRLLLPLLFGMFVIIPPQSYIQAIERYGYHGPYLSFWGRYLLADPTICRAGHCLFMPDWKHLWYVAYLWVYTLTLIGILAVLPGRVDRVQNWLLARINGWRILALPSLFFVLAQLGLIHFFPPTDDFVHDWYRHAEFFAAFLFGFLFATSPSVWNDLARYRWVSLALGIAAYATYMPFAWAYQSSLKPLPLGVAMHILYGVDQWSWVAAVFGFAHRLLPHRDGPARRYLSDAIFPYYIVHQTAIIVCAYALAKYALPVGLEATTLVAVTILTCLVTYEIVRRLPWLRPWLGLRRTDRPPVIGNSPAMRRSTKAQA